MGYVSPDQLQKNREVAEAIARENQRVHQEKLTKARELREHPEQLTATERHERFVAAQKLTLEHETKRSNMRYFTKEGADGKEVAYSAFVHPDIFAPAGYISSSFDEVPEDGRGGAAQFLQTMWGGEKTEGRANVVIFAMDNGDAIVVRRLKTDDPRLPASVTQEIADAQTQGMDPSKSAAHQYFEVRSSKSLRHGKRTAESGKIVHSSVFDGVVVIPGLPLKLSKDEHSGVTPKETEEAVSAVITLNDTDAGVVPPGYRTGRNDIIKPENNINALRAEVGEALATGKNIVRDLGKHGLLRASS